LGRKHSTGGFFPVGGYLYFEAAVRRRSSLAAFTHRDVDDVGKERLNQLTHFDVFSCDVGQGAPIAPNENFAILTFNSRLAAQAGENLECVLESFFSSAGIRYCMRCGHATTNLAQDCFELLGAKALFELGEDLA
jgi:hypothetical protein